MIVGVIWRPNDDVALELYKDLYYQIPVYQDELVRVYATNAYWVFVDEKNTSGGHLIYVEKEIPLKLAILAVEKVLFDELVLNVGSEEEKEEILDELSIPHWVKIALPLTDIAGEETDYKEGTTLIKVYVPTKVASELA